MKGNIKKLTVFVIIAAIAMFIVVGMASAGSTRFGPIMGHYVVTGSGNNLVSTTGFDNNYNPNPCPEPPPPFGCLVFQDAMILSGDLTFNKDGTGSFKQYNRGIDLPPLPPAFSLKLGYYEFIYTKTSERTFTYQLKPGTYMEAEFLAGGQTGQTVNFEVDGHCEGVLSQDLQNVIVTCGPTMSPPDFILTAVDPSSGAKLPIQAILSQSIVGIKVNE
jgi:hypothetical protein